MGKAVAGEHGVEVVGQAVLVEVCARHVHGDGHTGKSRLAPLLDVCAGHLPQAQVNLVDDALALEQRHETVGREEAELGVLPAYEGLGPDEGAGAYVHLGLQVQQELAFRHGLVHVVEQHEALLQLTAQRVVVVRHAPA